MSEKQYLEIFKEESHDKKSIKAVIFDFDGTISTLRHGWESVMESLMIEMINGFRTDDEDLIREIKDYIFESTGIQTIFQMHWLVDTVKRYGRNKDVHDVWWYKDEYNKRLLEVVHKRTDKLINGELKAKDFMIEGSEKFVKYLYDRGIDLYVASGTDNDDVVREVQGLGLKDYFKQISGAPYRKEQCSKDKVLRDLISNKGLEGSELLVVGDGKVEIALGCEVGAFTLGVASDEINRQGVNPDKRDRLVKAGADAIVGDFTKYDEIIKWLEL